MHRASVSPMSTPDQPRTTGSTPGGWPAALAWLVAWAAMFALDGRTDLGNQALLLVLASAVAALWWSPLPSMLACATAVLAFNYAFVPPRGTYAVGLGQHVVLLATMLAVSWIVALLMARQRRLVATVRRHFARAEQLRAFGESLRDVDDPRARGAALRDALSGLTGGASTLILVPAPPAVASDASRCELVGEADADEKAGLWLSLRESRALGPGTGRYEEQPAWFLPMRGRGASFGAALLRIGPELADAAATRAQAQALCDQMGAALERADALHAAAAAGEAARAQALRNALLAAISHDHRTPLATILGAASSLHDQDDRLTPPQRRRLAATIVDEATQLARLAENTLQLARLDAPGLVLPMDWESAEEIVGAVLRRARQREPARPIGARVAHGLPLLRCNAVLVAQLLDNLVDNALKHGDGPVEIEARADADRMIFAVEDRGPGVAPAWRSRMFDTFERFGPGPESGAADGPGRRGAGVGLALCRAIARAHGGEIAYREREGGGSRFEVTLPIATTPDEAGEPGGGGAAQC